VTVPKIESSNDGRMLLTPDGLEGLQAELERLRSQHRAFTERHSAAREPGGWLPGNIEDARQEQAELEGRIALLEERIGSAQVVEPDPTDGALGVGERARVRDLDSGETIEYRLVGTIEADPTGGSISYTSPVGAALLGRHAGDIVHVEVPSGIVRLEVLEVET
jgi:transcription elongation factor GreA